MNSIQEIRSLGMRIHDKVSDYIEGMNLGDNVLAISLRSDKIEVTDD